MYVDLAELNQEQALEHAPTLMSVINKLPGTAAKERYIDMHADNADAALVAFEEAIRNDPKDPRLKGLLAAMYLRFGGSSQAFAVMRKVADIDPQDNGRLKRGLLSVSLGAQNEAIAAFRKVTNDRRNSSVAHSSIGVMFYHLGQRPRAQAAVTAALKADDSNIAARLYEAQIALERGALGRAEESARTILDIDRGSAMGHLMLGRIYERKGSAKEAVAAYESALRSSPGLMVAKVELAGLQHQAGEAEEALSILTQAFEIYPQMASTRRLLFRIGY